MIPELNGTEEWKYHAAGNVLCALIILIRSGLSKDFSWKAYVAARFVLHSFSYMLFMECVPGGSVSSLWRLGVWGCKAYVLVPASSRRKDWEDKAWTGYFVGYSEDESGWTMKGGDVGGYYYSMRVFFLTY